MPPRDQPPPLPPETRTVGQLIAEAVRLYGRRLWRSLAVGVLAATWALLPRLVDPGTGLARGALLVGAVLLSAAYVIAVGLATGTLRRAGPALAAGAIVFLPFQVLIVFLVFPALLWLAAVGLVVPVVMREDRGFLESFRRAFALARADYVHALGSLAALAIVVVVAASAMTFALRDFGDQALAVASFVAWVVILPVFFLGAALLYDDQAARAVDSPPRRTRPRRRRNAHVHPALDADAPGRSDAPVEPRTPARGEP